MTEPLKPPLIPWAERERRAKAGKPAASNRGTLAIAIAALALSIVNFATGELAARAEQRRLLMEEAAAGADAASKTQLALLSIIALHVRAIERRQLPQREHELAIANAMLPQQSADAQRQMFDFFLGVERAMQSRWSWIYSTPDLESARFSIAQLHKLENTLMEQMTRTEQEQRLAEDHQLQAPKPGSCEPKVSP